ASFRLTPVACERSRALEELGLAPGGYLLLTIHREANTEPERLRRLIAVVNATGRTFVFPVHPRTRKALDEHGIEPGPQVRQLAPVGYLEMLALVAGARAVVTDSGGLQKEAYWLRVPCVTLRPSTEWVDTVRVGANTLIDPDDPARLGEVLEHATFPEEAPELYGDGRAAARIAEALYTLRPA
ncbi:MAG: UDP-N-acetylglucosamine 2-epimerase, partial [Gaiellaceae bacterium]